MRPAPRSAKETVFFLFLPSCSKRKKRSAPHVTGLYSRHPCASPDRVLSSEVEEEKSAKRRKKDSLVRVAFVLRPLCQGDWFPGKWARRGARLMTGPFFLGVSGPNARERKFAMRCIVFSAARYGGRGRAEAFFGRPGIFSIFGLSRFSRFWLSRAAQRSASDFE